LKKQDIPSILKIDFLLEYEPCFAFSRRTRSLLPHYLPRTRLSRFLLFA